MTLIEHCWPPEMLAEVFPERYRHLVLDWSAQEDPFHSKRYTVGHLELSQAA
jgi:hypothetical protein